MSEQEKKSGGTAIDNSVIMVEKTTGSRHKQPYRPTELQDENDLHHKHSKAPVVPSVVEELKIVAENSATDENVEIEARTEYEHAISSEKHKHSVAKKLSSSTKRRESSPESIALKSLEVDKKKTPFPPIPTQEQSEVSADDKDALKKADEDSITEEVGELRSPDVAKEHSEWSDDEEAGGLPRSDSRASRVSRMDIKASVTKKKEISWKDREYEQNVVLQEIGARSEAWMLDRKASVGPCYRPGMPFEGPSGIMICMPKKSMKCINQPSGISINISGKCIDTKSKTTVCNISKSKSEKFKAGENECEKANMMSTCVDNFKQKLDNMHMKIRSFFHI